MFWTCLFLVLLSVQLAPWTHRYLCRTKSRQARGAPTYGDEERCTYHVHGWSTLWEHGPASCELNLVQHCVACACPTSESARVPQVKKCKSQGSSVKFLYPKNWSPSFSVYVTADLHCVSAAQRLTITCNRPLLKRKGGCGFVQRRFTGNMWATIENIPCNCFN